MKRSLLRQSRRKRNLLRQNPPRQNHLKQNRKKPSLQRQNPRRKFRPRLSRRQRSRMKRSPIKIPSRMITPAATEIPMMKAVAKPSLRKGLRTTVNCGS